MNSALHVFQCWEGSNLMALYHCSAKLLSRSTRNTVGAVAYRAGCQLKDLRTGEIFDYQSKPVQHVELVLPQNAPLWATNIQKAIGEDRQSGVQALSEKVEAAELRINSQVWREIEVALHRELTDDQNIALAKEFAEDQLCGRGMAALLNFHFDSDEITGERKPHCHILLTLRPLDERGFNPKKKRSWNAKALMCELREQWAHYSNFHLKLHGHEVQIDHRSYYDRGIEIEPQPKQGKGVLEQERRVKKGRGVLPITDKAQAFQAVQLRNLYRILRRPEVVFDIVTKHHTTFMWADMQRVLHRYIDEVPLFQRMEARLMSSQELVQLHSARQQNERGGDFQQGSNPTWDKSIYTTRSMLKNEASLVQLAEELGRSQSHGVEKNQVEREMVHAYQGLGIMGGLSQDQECAIQHIVGEGQLSCVVGIAGSGKTTILKVCQSVWESEGYAVYGLAPTGKAAQNLEQSGISSTTIHKFLKELESGRCQYQAKSVLILDEAGMVDVERFSYLLKAVKQLGVKLVVVGDGAQLQPVEAGPAFRLITERVGKAQLMTVMRQKEDWQKEATKLFGKQRTQEALQRYMERGCVHIVAEKLPVLSQVLKTQDWSSLIRLYEVSNRVSSRMYREMARDGEAAHLQTRENRGSVLIRDHQDFGHYLNWKDLEKQAAKHILQNSVACRPLLRDRAIDTLKLAMCFSGKTKSLPEQYEVAQALLKHHGLEPLSRLEQHNRSTEQGVELRQATKESLLKAWHTGFQASLEKGESFLEKASPLILAFSNRDVNDLNKQARFLLKTSGYLPKEEFTYTIKRETEDDFGKKTKVLEEKGFSKGDRIVFTRNNYGLRVKNGTMATITELTPQKIHVKVEGRVLAEEREMSFAPTLNPFFDHGWALTIHKSQGTTAHKTYLLASADMTQNLSYVAMTRHREDVQVFGSSLEFWREEKLPEMLSKSGEKLSAADYLDAHSLEELMKQEDRLLTKIFTRISDELEAMGAVSKRAFWHVADRFLGIHCEQDIRMPPMEFSRGGLREEARAESLLQDKKIRSSGRSSEAALIEEKVHKEISFVHHQSSAEKSSGHYALKESAYGREVQNKPKHRTQGAIPRGSFDELKKFCEERLYKVMEKEGNILTVEGKQRFSLQAEKTATFLFHSHLSKGLTPTEREISYASLRAKYELKRIPQIREKIIKTWKAHNNFKDQEKILAHSIAERRASIEGRLYLEAKQQGLTPLSAIAELARQELKEHRNQIASLAHELARAYYLSEDTAHQCAKDIFRYKETHGESPFDTRIFTLVQIAKTLEHKDYENYSAAENPHEIDFLRRKEAEILLRHVGSHGNEHEWGHKDLSLLVEKDELLLELSVVRSQLKASLDTEKLHASQKAQEIEPEREHDHGISR